jgi:serine/threonine-protein kinase
MNQLFQQALEFPETARTNFLAEACAGDDEMRATVEQRLATESGPICNTASTAEMTKAETTFIEPDQALGAYRLTRRLGRGGMGEVHLAYDTRLSRQVAVKLLPAHFTQDPERVRRFEREARTVSALNHPNIVTIHDFGQQDGRHFIVTEFVEGQTLRAALQQARPTLAQALDYTIQIAGALAAAHQAGIIHRDIKPENIMLRPDGYVKVLDFGLAKLAEPIADSGEDEQKSEAATCAPSAPSHFETRSGVMLGTVNYMSPEQARGQKPDVRTDVFSLGVVLYEMLAGVRPFTGPTANHVLVAILDAEPPPLDAQLPASLRDIVQRALRKDRTERYPTAAEMLTALQRAKKDWELAEHLQEARTSGSLTNRFDAVRSTQSSGASFVGRFRRHKSAALAALLLLLALVAGLVYYRSTRPPDAAIDSLAVLPFVNQTRTPETDYLADGLTESIINNLAQLSELHVIARSSAFRFKGKTDDPLGAARQLRARAVVVGRVLQQGDQLTIHAELVDVEQNKQLWGQQYQRRLTDLFAVQEEIAQEISAKLRLQLSEADRRHLSKRHTGNLKAFQYYTQGRQAIQLRTRENTELAIRYYEKALAEDPNYALAYTGLADAHTILGARAYIAPSLARRKTEEMARKALALDANLAEAHTALGQIWWYAPYNFAQTDRALRRALELNPNLASTYAYLCYSLAGQSRFEESLQAIAKARELDPLSSAIARTEALPYLLKRDYNKALELLRQATELGPPFTQTWEIGAYLPTKRFEQALAELEQTQRTRPNDPVLIGSTGIVYATQGKRTAALQIIKQLETMAGTSLSEANWITKIYAAMNEQEKALSLLERSLAADEIGVFYKNEPMWDSIRHTPRFAELMRRMGIP